MASYGSAYSGSEFYLDGGEAETRDIKSMMDHYYNISYTPNSAMWVQGAIDKRFKVGDQTLYSMMYGDNQYAQARRFFFNLCRRHINMICGYQRKTESLRSQCLSMTTILFLMSTMQC